MPETMLILEHGFLPEEDPLQRLPVSFDAWENMARDLPKLLLTDNIRFHIEQLPAFAFDMLSTARQMERAMLIMSFIGHAYVWGQKPVVDKIPASIAIPWYHLSQTLQRPAVLSYASYALNNWRRIDSHKPVELGNIVLLQNFLGGQDEEWFVLVHIDIEAKAIPAISAISAALEAVTNRDRQGLLKQLGIMGHAQELMLASLKRMTLHCDPYIYFNRVRPYIFGWKDNPALPDGLIYRGVCDYRQQGQKFRGETGAQSAIFPCLDAFLGIEHSDDALRSYLGEMRDYMPLQHRQFIQQLEQRSTVRAFVAQHKSSSPELLLAYNACIAQQQQFRQQHLEFAANYIASQHADGVVNSSSIGTGGTPFMPYLKKHLSETAIHRL